MLSSAIDALPRGVLRSRPMKRPSAPEAPAQLNFRNIPRETLYRLKMAAAAEHKTVRELVMELIEGKIQELEKKGVLPKTRG